MSDSSDNEDPVGDHQADTDDTNAIQQVGEFVSMIMNTMPSSALPSSSSHPPSSSSSSSSHHHSSSASSTIGAVIGMPDLPASPLPPLENFPVSPESSSCSDPLRSFISEARSLFSYYQRCLQLIEGSSKPDFEDWDWLDSCMDRMAKHPRVSDKMKLRYFLHNKDNARTFRLIQKNFRLNLDEQFYMGKMNLLHVSCDTGWSNLTRELVSSTGAGMNVNLPCPSLHMRPGNLTPLMLSAGAGHKEVVKVLLERDDVLLDARDTEGFTALFHACNHGTNRIGDQHGYFRRLWSWDLSQQQLNSMEKIARENSLSILKLLINHGADIRAKDRSGATALYRASTVENFHPVIEFLVECGFRVTQNILHWARVKNPDSVELLESELVTPRSLARQSRLVIWDSVRRSGCVEGVGASFPAKLRILQERVGLPVVLYEYLKCE